MYAAVFTPRPCGFPVGFVEQTLRCNVNTTAAVTVTRPCDTPCRSRNVIIYSYTAERSRTRDFVVRRRIIIHVPTHVYNIYMFFSFRRLFKFTLIRPPCTHVLATEYLGVALTLPSNKRTKYGCVVCFVGPADFPSSSSCRSYRRRKRVARAGAKRNLSRSYATSNPLAFYHAGSLVSAAPRLRRFGNASVFPAPSVGRARTATPGKTTLRETRARSPRVFVRSRRRFRDVRTRRRGAPATLSS